MGDLDGDGDLDLVGTSHSAPHVYVLRNETEPAARFLSVDLRAADHRSAAGSRILVTAGGRTFRRDVHLGAGFLSQHETAQHFGLGQADSVDRVEITWPDGQTTTIEDVPVDNRILVHQGSPDWGTTVLHRAPALDGRGAGTMEWTDDPHRIHLLQTARPDLASMQVASLDDSSPDDSPVPVVAPEADGRARHVTVLVLLSATCEACAREAPLLGDLGRNPPSNTRFLGLFLDPDAPAAALRETAAGWGLDIPLARVRTRGQVERLERGFRAWSGPEGWSLPAILILTPGGKVKALAQGAVRPDALRKYLNRTAPRSRHD
jgi:hypothetical protein